MDLWDVNILLDGKRKTARRCVGEAKVLFVAIRIQSRDRCNAGARARSRRKTPVPALLERGTSFAHLEIAVPEDGAPRNIPL